MNIWVEYWKSKDNRSHTSMGSHAQMKEQAVWIPPNTEDISRRFCQNREDAFRFAKAMQERGLMVSIKTDSGFPIK